MISSAFFAFAVIPLTLALPTTPSTLSKRQSTTAWTWNQGATPDYTIHASCNHTERAQLSRALSEAVTLASHARDHINRWGKESELYVKYFGNATTAEPAGWFDHIVNGDKTGVLFRCDDIDQKCYQDGWAGHWRGESFPDQTVICELSFSSRWNLESICAHGYTVANGRDALYFGADLLHRLHHTEKMGQKVVEHYADSQAEVLKLAIDNPALAVRNSVTLRHFAVEVYAYDILAPGTGCPGVLPASTVPSNVPASTTVPTPATTTASAATECHTHADGVVHCV